MLCNKLYCQKSFKVETLFLISRSDQLHEVLALQPLAVLVDVVHDLRLHMKNKYIKTFLAVKFTTQHVRY